MTALVSALVTVVVIVFAIFIAMRTFILVRQAQTAIVERLGKYHSTLSPGLHFVVPIIDKVVARIDMREQVVVFQPQSVITRDNLVVSIDSVVYFQVADAERSTYEIQDYLTAYAATTSEENMAVNAQTYQWLCARCKKYLEAEEKNYADAL